MKNPDGTPRVTDTRNSVLSATGLQDRLKAVDGTNKTSLGSLDTLTNVGRQKATFNDFVNRYGNLGKSINTNTTPAPAQTDNTPDVQETFAPTDVTDTTVDTNTGSVKRTKRVGIASSINL